MQSGPASPPPRRACRSFFPCPEDGSAFLFCFTRGGCCGVTGASLLPSFFSFHLRFRYTTELTHQFLANHHQEFLPGIRRSCHLAIAQPWVMSPREYKMRAVQTCIAPCDKLSTPFSELSPSFRDRVPWSLCVVMMVLNLGSSCLSLLGS